MVKVLVKWSFLILFSCAAVFSVTAQNSLFVSQENIRIEPDSEGTFGDVEGYHLFVKKLPGVESILLTETTKDPAGKEDNYAYRALEYNSVNGDEIRILNGKKLDSKSARYSLVDSTPEYDEEFGQAFHIYIPSKMQFGYPWTRNGIVTVGRGTFINIRAFSKKYADYTGEFFDNSFMFDIGTKVVKTEPMPPAPVFPELPDVFNIEEIYNSEKKEEAPAAEETAEQPEEVPEAEETVETVKSETAEEVSPSEAEITESEEETSYVPGEEMAAPEDEPEERREETVVLTDAYSPKASEEFSKFAEFVTYSKGPETIVQDIMDSVNAITPKDYVDVVFAIDATGSMKDDIEQLREEWVPALEAGLKQFKHIRLGLLLYRDYGDNFKYNGLPVRFFNFTDDVNIFARNLNNYEIKGKEGGDIPEAVYEALYGSMEFYKWNEEAVRKIILIGDAEPHPVPRGSGKYSKDLIMQMSADKDICIEAIITPDDKTARGR